MKHLALVLALGLAGTSAALAQNAPGTGTTDAPPPSAPLSPSASVTPPMPQLDAAKSAEVQRQLGLYRTEIDGRVARGEISAEEAGRLLQWREWQIAQQVAGLAPPPGPVMEQVPAPAQRTYYAAPYYATPYYAAPAYPYPYAYPYYAPVYRPYYWGASICAGGWGHHGGARVCF